jgi:hypothetical protein
MIIELTHLPIFTRGQEFRGLSPKEGKRIYRFKTIRRNRLAMRGLVKPGVIISFHDAKGIEWGRIDQFGILISENYAWNGCSPKRWIPIFGWIGTPDFECTLLASLFHDLLYQMSECKHMIFTRGQTDDLFKTIIELHDEFDIAAIYHGAVHRFGANSWLTRSGCYSRLIA